MNDISAKYAIGLDQGTNSVRAGRGHGERTRNRHEGGRGPVARPKPARQYPADDIEGGEVAIKKTLIPAKKNGRGFKAELIAGIGVAPPFG